MPKYLSSLLDRLDISPQMRQKIVQLHNHLDQAFDVLRLDDDSRAAISLIPFIQLLKWPHDHPEVIAYSQAAAQKFKGLDDIEEAKEDLLRNEKTLASTSEDHLIEKLKNTILSLNQDHSILLLKIIYEYSLLKIGEENSNGFFYPKKLRNQADEFMGIYYPILTSLGIWAIYKKAELLCFKIKAKLTFQKIQKLVLLSFPSFALSDELSNEQPTIKHINKILRVAGIDAQVSGRFKSIYSIWKKMKRDHLEDLPVDAFGVRVIVKTVADCYLTMGALHTTHRCITSELDDYISNPKPNGYQSIHTILRLDHGALIEVQIRTEAMEKVANAGMASHRIYKQGMTFIPGLNEKIDKFAAQFEHGSDVEQMGSLSMATLAPSIIVFDSQGTEYTMSKGTSVGDFVREHTTDIEAEQCDIQVNLNYCYDLTTLLKDQDTVQVTKPW